MAYSYSWFKWWHSTVRDAKLTDLSAEVRWVWPTLLTLASESKTRGIIIGHEAQLANIAHVATVPVEAVQQALKIFSERRMVRAGKRGIIVRNFLDRQYDRPSDHPGAVRGRVSKHRASHQKRASNVAETTGNAGATPQKREEEKREEETGKEFPSFISPNPNGNGFHLTADQKALVAKWNRYVSDAPAELRVKRTTEALGVLSQQLGLISSEQVRQIMLAVAEESR